MGEKRGRDEVLAFSAGIYESLMLSVLDLCVTTNGQLWSMKDGVLCQNLSWTPEEAIAYIVGKMLDPEVREKITTSLIDWA